MVTFATKQPAQGPKGTYYKVTTTDGKAGAVFGLDPALNQPYDLMEKFNQQFNNYNWFQKNAQSGVGTGFKKSGFSGPSRATTRGEALKAAVQMCEKVNGTVTSDHCLSLADKFFAWITKPEETPAPVV